MKKAWSTDKHSAQTKRKQKKQKRADDKKKKNARPAQQPEE